MRMKIAFVSALLINSFCTVVIAGTVNFQDIDGPLGSQTLVSADTWNNSSKTITNFARIRGLEAGVSFLSTTVQWSSTQKNFHFNTTNSLLLGAIDKQTSILTFIFNHPISGSIGTSPYFGDVGTVEKLQINVTGGSATLSDLSAQSTTAGLNVTYESGLNAAALLTVSPLISYENILLVQLEYTCDYLSANVYGCGSTRNVVISDGVGDIRTISAGDDQVEFSGTTLTIYPASALMPSTNYFVQVDATAVQNANGQRFAGINDTTTVNFSTAAAPTVSVTGALATANSLDPFEVTIAFSKAVPSAASTGRKNDNSRPMVGLNKEKIA